MTEPTYFSLSDSDSALLSPDGVRQDFTLRANCEEVRGPSSGPLIVSQPTTPIESPLVNRRLTPRERRDEPRRVADRSLAMRGSGSSLAWIWVVLAVLGGIGGGFYYYKSRGFATGVGVSDIPDVPVFRVRRTCLCEPWEIHR